MTLAAFGAVFLLHLAAAVSPGPAVLTAARAGLDAGFARGAWVAVGIGLGACVWAAAALFGLAVLFAAAPALLTALRLAGAAYLIRLAVQMWRRAPEPVAPPRPGGAPARGAAGFVWLGLATQLANPKPAVFFGTVFLTFVPPGTPAAACAAILAMVFVNEAAWNIAVVRIFSLGRTRRIYIGLKTRIDRICAGLLALLAARLALS